MAVIHNGGRVKRAQAVANTPLYAVFSSAASQTESSSLPLSNIISGARVNKQYLVKQLQTAPTDTSVHCISLNGGFYQIFSPSESYKNLNNNSASMLLVEVEISPSTIVIPTGPSLSITSIFIVSGLERFHSISSGTLNIIPENVISAGIADGSNPISLEAAHVLSSPISPSVSNSFYVQFLLEF